MDSLNRGGSEVLELDLCRHAAPNGLDLTLVATGGGDLEAEFRRSGVDYVRWRRRWPVDLRVVAQLRRLIKARRIDVAHSFQAVEALHVYLATLGTQTRQVLSFQGYTPDAKNRWALHFLAPRMAVNLAPTHGFLNALKNAEGFDITRNFRVLHLGVDADRLRPQDRRLRAELGLAAGDLLLGMVANFYPDARKDQLTVCRALPTLFRQAPTAHCVFVGGHLGAGERFFNECVSFCRAQGIGDRVHFLGKRGDIPEVLNSLDLFVFSSRMDTFGIAVVEAMLVGLPTVVSDIDPLLEVSAKGEYAAVFRTGDADDLARCLIELAIAPARRAELGARARQWATEQFSIAVYSARLRALYSAVVSM
jgi:L-malate glycosyltransferase